MLTTISHIANFPPLMKVRQKKIWILVMGILMLQSCYTLVNPPLTLPQSVTTIISQPAMASSIGGAGAYGWDPYWEPALPFTNYHRGYGASYYSPYNYYDYHHPYYAPVYISGEVHTPSPGREFGRDDSQGGGRERELIGSGTGSGANRGGGTTGQESGMSSAASEIISPAKPTPVATPPYKAVSDRGRNAAPPLQQIIPIRVNEGQPVKNEQISQSSKDTTPPKRQITPNVTTNPKPEKSVNNKDSSDSTSSPKKRSRTRK